MLCQYCKQHNANTHIKRTVNGNTTELYVCSDCASKLKIDLYNTSAFDVGNLFGGLFTAPSLLQTDAAEHCNTCGKSFREIVQSGIVGCPDCYVQFFDRLQPSIQRIHGKTSHVGKVAEAGSAQSRKKLELITLKDELSKALSLQEYERCATLRDRIKELEGEEHD